MASSSRTKSSGRYDSSPSSFAVSSSRFSSRSSTFFPRSPSPTPVKMYGHYSSLSPSPSTSIRFLIDNRPNSPSRSISIKKQANNPLSSNQKKTCMCSPTTHPGSFRCSLHKNLRNSRGSGAHRHNVQAALYQSSGRLNFRRSAMVNSLVRIGVVEGGDLVKRALSALIRPSSHQQRRRAAFRPRPSRLSIMSNADDL